jgi:hypothetical protein
VIEEILRDPYSKEANVSSTCIGFFLMMYMQIFVSNKNIR